MFYWNRADMGNYDAALALSPVDPNVTLTRTYSSIKYGVGLNLEQELTTNLGGFLRLGWDDGHTETWAFTECDRTAAFGFILKGAALAPRRRRDWLGIRRQRPLRSPSRVFSAPAVWASNWATGS